MTPNHSKVLYTDQEKLQALVREAGLTPTEIARALETTYRTVHRWMARGVLPHPQKRREIDELFKEHIDLSRVIDRAVQRLKNPLEKLRTNLELQERFFLLVTYHSNAIEGSRMSIQETELALQDKTVRGKEPFEVFEAVNHRNALKIMLEEAGPGFRMTEDYILKIHSVVMYNFHNKLPGKYRTGHVNLTNTEKTLPSAQMVPLKMKKLVRDMQQKRPEIIQAFARDHYEFESIHPFFDGNGRVGRILMMTQFLSCGYPPPVIRIDDQYAYYTALTKGDMGDTRHLTQMIADSVLRGYGLLEDGRLESREK